MPVLATRKLKVLSKRLSGVKSRRWLPCDLTSSLGVPTPANLCRRVPPVLLPQTVPFQNKNPTHAALIGQQIAPWPVLIATVSPAKKDRPARNDLAKKTMSPAKAFKPTHKRTMTPAPEPEPEPSLQPLKPARTRAQPNHTAILGTKADLGLTIDVQSKGEGFLEPAPFSSGTFGSMSLSSSRAIEELVSTGGSGSLSPVFKLIRDTEVLKRASADDGEEGNSPVTCSRELDDSFDKSFAAPIAMEVRTALGRSGTLGGSDISGYGGGQLGASDPDSDVPDELKFILAAHSDGGSIMEEQNTPTMTLLPLEPTSVNDNPDMVQQTHELPVFRLTLTDDDDQNGFGIDGESAHSSEEDTKKSFDFTGEIKRLNESGASDRASFVEQLEMAFKTPAKIDLHCDFGTNLRVEVPFLPALPCQ